MSVMDMFRNIVGQPAQGPGNQVQQPQNNGQPINGQDPTLNGGNPTVPGAGTVQSDGSIAAFPKAGEGDKSPLAGFQDLWDKKDTDGKPPSLIPNLTIDPVKIAEMAKGMDFAKVIPPEIIQKAIKGDAEAFGQALNMAVQASFAQSSVATSKIVEAALTQQADRFNSEVMPEVLRRHDASRGLRTENPIFENPAVKPMLAMAEQQLAIKYPAAAASEIQAKAKEFVLGFAQEVVKGDGKTIVDPALASSAGRSPLTRKDEDWSKYFDVGA